MNRRSFLKYSSSAGVCLMLTPSSVFFSNGLKESLAESVDENFNDPPQASKPMTWWHWMNGNITKPGITRDLEAMKAAGLGGFQLFDAGTGIVKGPVEFLSEQWLELIGHAITESERLGLDFGMHNCPGWSSSGGPWITPEMSMQQLTWSETLVQPHLDQYVKLNRPESHLDYYRDAKVIAYPLKEKEKFDPKREIKSIQHNEENLSISSFLKNGHDLIVPEGNDEASIEISFKRAIDLANITLYTGVINGSGEFYIEMSTDGNHFERSASFTGGSNNREVFGSMPASANFYPIKVKAIKLVSRASRFLRSVQFSKIPKLNNWLRNANFRNAGWDQGAIPESSYETIDPDQVIDLTGKLDQNGDLNWSPTSGSWMVLRLGHTASGKHNHSAPETGTGLECDKFSKEAFHFHFDHMFKKIMPKLETLRKQGKVGLLIDSYEMGMQNWTKNMTGEFNERRHYDITPYLPVLTGKVVNSPDESHAFLRDFRRTCADLMADNYHGKFDKICKKLNITSYTEPYGRGPFEEMQVGSRVDYNMGEFWSGNTVLWANIGMKRTMKLASSIAHINGQNIVGAEAFTAEPGSGKWQQHPYSLKALGDWMFTKGLNRIIFHRYAHQPHPTAAPGMTMGPWGIHFERTNTWWQPAKAWLNYLARNQYILQQGQFVADLAYLAPDTPGKAIHTMPDQIQPAPPSGYDYDLISPESLVEASMDNGLLKVNPKTGYKIIILQDTTHIALPVLKKLWELKKDGLPIYGKPPRQPAGLLSDEEEKSYKELVNLIWKSTLSEASQHKNLTYTSGQLKNILNSLDIQPDLRWTSRSNDAPISYIHRKSNGEHFYFIANRRRSTEEIVTSFRVTQAIPEIWDADTGKMYPYLFYTFENYRTKVWLRLQPAGSCLVIFRKKTTQPGIRAISFQSKPTVQLSDFTERRFGLYEETYNNFGLSLWVKPEIAIPLTEDQFFGQRKTDHFAIYPIPGNLYYGENHSNLGLAVGRNGLTVFERENTTIEKNFSVKRKISGWTHIAILVEDSHITLKINGREVNRVKSLYKHLHPGINEAFQEEGASYYHGDIQLPELYSVDQLKSELSTILKRKNFAQPLPAIEVTARGIRLNAEGHYKFDLNNHDKSVQVGPLVESDLSNEWTVQFPPGKGAPKRISLQKLTSLHLHEQHGIRHFSGTASYHKEFSLHPERDPSKRYILDLGEVEVIAEVMLNGHALGTLWKPPFRIDLTDQLQKDTNHLHIKVTNLWPNRLIGDEDFPERYAYASTTIDSKFSVLANGAIEELPKWYKKNDPMPLGKRVAFTTWKHYSKGDPLLASGLIGPVTIRESKLIQPKFND